MSKSVLKKTFVLYQKHEKLFDRLNDEEAGKLIRAIFVHARGGEIELEGKLQGYFDSISDDLDENHKNWQAKCKKNTDNINERWRKYRELEEAQKIKDTNNTKDTNDTTVLDGNNSIRPNTTVFNGNDSIPTNYDSDNDSDNEINKNKKEKGIKQNSNTPPTNTKEEKKGGGKKIILENDLKKINNEFKEFWNVYIPVKKTNGKVKEKGSEKTAKIAYAQALCNNYTSKQILEGSEKYLKNCQQNNILTCEVVTFLKEERFLNEYGNTVEAETATDEPNQNNIALLEYSQVLGIAKNFSDNTHEGYIFKNLITNAVVSDLGGIQKIAKIIREKDGYDIKPNLSYFKHDFQKTWIAFNKNNQTCDKVSGRLSKLIRESNWKGDGGVYEKNPIIEVPDLSLKKREQQL